MEKQKNSVVDNGDMQLAKELMKVIQYSNGCVDRWHKEKYPDKWIKAIAPAAKLFYEANPQLLNEEDILEMCDGCLQEREEKWGNLVGYKELDNVLNDYFNKGL